MGLAAKAATATIPVVFSAGADPVEIGLVPGRPERNLTGISLWTAELDVKRLDLLREVLPNARTVALLMNPTNPDARNERRGTQQAAVRLGIALDIHNASSSAEIERAFQALPAGKVDALAVVADDGGLMSYGTRWAEMYRIVGTYAGRILKGEKPADLPVQRPTTYELAINLRTARSLELAPHPLLLSRADEVID